MKLFFAKIQKFLADNTDLADFFIDCPTLRDARAASNNVWILQYALSAFSARDKFIKL